jgi:two-component system NtrC family response regulator
MHKLHAAPSEVVLLDVGLPDGNGLDALSKIRQTPPFPEVIIITGHGDQDGAEVAIQNGAWDYIQKPLIRREVMLALKRVLQYRHGSHKPVQTAVSLRLDNIVGSSPQIKACYDSLAQAANCDVNVLITGETGTGKELFAHAIHINSSRSGGNFVVVDCAALPETLVESTLFGHEKGAFTGADKYREGLIKQADGGTLFLDEVGELPLPVQRAFLRVLQERRCRPVGGQTEIKSNFRLVAATNRSLGEMAKAGLFRQDLLFRLRSMTIELPPLRERVGDTKELVIYYMNQLCDRYGISAKGFAAEFFSTLAAYNWPGNVRELVNAIENIIATAGDDPVLFPQHLPKSIRSAIARASFHSKTGANRVPGLNGECSPLDATLKDFREGTVQKAEKTYLQRLMSIAGDNIQKSCRLSGLSRPRLYALLKKHQISRFDIAGPA